MRRDPFRFSVQFLIQANGKLDQTDPKEELFTGRHDRRTRVWSSRVVEEEQCS